MITDRDITELSAWIKDYVTKAGRTHCVVGVSGGIDSAVVAALCAKVLPTIGVRMPMYTVNGDSSKRAMDLCIKTGIQCIDRPINGDSYPYDPATNKLAYGNWCARQRMATLYATAELNNALVIGTDNLSEAYVGFFSKFGDGGVDINPIGQYFKSEVYALAKLLNVPQSIIDAVPTAELWDGQTDESELGLSYVELEWAIRWFNDNKYVIDLLQYGKDGYCYDILLKVQRMHLATEHKRALPPEYQRV